MKIDLHIHTKKVAKGDPKTRNIGAIEFKQKMKDANVGIAAITNHYIFIEEDYIEKKSDDYILLPGVELDINLNGRKVQANVIANPNDIDVFIQILDEIDNKNKPIEYEEFVKKFNNKKWIISLDYKNSQQTSWRPDEMRNVMKEMNQSFVLTDTNKATTWMILNSHSFNALIGSDIQDWNSYQKKSENLLSTRLEIENYNNFWSILKYGTISTDDLFGDIEEDAFKNIKMPNTDYSINEIKIKQGVNVIFGPKKTGKTEILKWLCNKKATNQCYYSSSEKEATINELQNKMLDKKEFLDEKKSFEGMIDKILNYEESKFTNFSDYYSSLKGNVKITFQNKLDISEMVPETIPNEASALKNIKIIVNSIETTYDHLEKIEIKNQEWIKQSEYILKAAWDKYKGIYRKYWISDINLKIKEGIDALNLKNNGIKPKPHSIGLLKRYKEKQLFRNNITKLKRFQKTITKKIKSFEIPGRVEVSAIQKCIFLDFFTDKKNEENMELFPGKKGKISSIRKITDKELNINLLVEEIRKFSDDSKKFYAETVTIEDKKGDKNFSNGEKAHLILHEFLSQNKEYFLLDEPAVFMSRESITDFLIPTIARLSKEGKKIVIATHNSSIGVNTIPINYIFRKYINHNDECQTYTGSIWKKEFVNINDENDKLGYLNEIIGAFEGSEKHFNFRKDIYEN